MRKFLVVAQILKGIHLFVHEFRVQGNNKEEARANAVSEIKDLDATLEQILLIRPL